MAGALDQHQRVTGALDCLANSTAKMRVGIDASFLLLPNKTGVETYTLNLVRALLALEDRPATFLYAAGASVPPDAVPLFAAADRTRLSRHRREWLRLRLPASMFFDRIDVAHFPGTFLPPRLPCPAVSTFYDLAAARYPGLYNPEDLKHYEYRVPEAARRARAVLAVSECTRLDLLEFYSLPAEKVFVTPLGVHPRFAPTSRAAATVASRFNLLQPYMLACVGSGHPRKNLRVVFEAFAELDEPKLLLAVLGDPQRDAAAYRLLEQMPARRRVVFLGHVSEEDLPAIYSAASVFCFPSLYEGFGLPVLEAMACGAPVVCSNTSSLPEVVGNAALTADPTDPVAFAEALSMVLTDSDRRKAMSQAGLERARHFTWERTIRLTVAAYRYATGQV